MITKIIGKNPVKFCGINKSSDACSYTEKRLNGQVEVINKEAIVDVYEDYFFL